MSRSDRSITRWVVFMLAVWFFLAAAWLGCRAPRPVPSEPDAAAGVRAGLERALQEADRAAAGR